MLYLANGQCSNNVVALQNALNLTLPPEPPLVLDGIFGPKTEAATRNFQRHANLLVDGIAGPQTLGTLFEGVEVEPTVGGEIEPQVEPAAPVINASRSPWSPPGLQRQGGQDGRRAVPPPVSFGAVEVLNPGWFTQSWLDSGFPKKPLVLPPEPPLHSIPTLTAIRRYGLNVLDLGSTSRKLNDPRGFAFYNELGGSLIETEIYSKFCVARIKEPSLALCRGWKESREIKGDKEKYSVGAHYEIKAKPFTLFNKESYWRLLNPSVRIDSVLSTSLLTPMLAGPNNLGYTKGNFFAGIEADIRLLKSEIFNTLVSVHLRAYVGYEAYLKVYREKNELKFEGGGFWKTKVPTWGIGFGAKFGPRKKK
jgi:hypothetical protein